MITVTKMIYCLIKCGKFWVLKVHYLEWSVETCNNIEVLPCKTKVSTIVSFFLKTFVRRYWVVVARKGDWDSCKCFDMYAGECYLARKWKPERVRAMRFLSCKTTKAYWKVVSLHFRARMSLKWTHLLSIHHLFNGSLSTCTSPLVEIYKVTSQIDVQQNAWQSFKVGVP